MEKSAKHPAHKPSNLILEEKHGVGLPIPEKVREAAIRLLCSGVGIVATARGLGVSDNTVVQIREENADQLPDWRTASKKKLQSLVLLGGERLVREVNEIPIATLSVAVAIAIDKILLLDGEATMRIDHVHRSDSGRFSGWMGQMLAPPPHQLTIDAQVVDTKPQVAGQQPAKPEKANDSNPGEGVV